VSCMAGVAVDTARKRGCCFSPSEAQCLVTFTSGRWRLWGEEEGSADVTHRDTAETYTSACWGPGAQRLSLGCASGRVQVWDPHSGELAGPVAEAFRAAAGSSALAAVTALAPSKSHREVVYAGCQAIPEILEIDVSDGSTNRSFKSGKLGICQLAACIDVGVEWLLAAGSGNTMRLWYLADAASDQKPQVHAKLSAPANTASCLDLCCNGDGHVLALCADGGMQIDIFRSANDRGGAGDTKETLGVAFVLSSHERILSARFTSSSTKTTGSQAQTCVVGFGPTVVSMWKFSAENEVAKGAKALRTLAAEFTVSADDLGGRVLCARACAPPSPLVVAFGPLVKPSFAKVRAPATKQSSAIVEHCGEAVAEAKSAEKKASKTKAAKEAADKAAPVMLGPMDDAAPRQQQKRKRLLEHPMIEEDSQTSKKAAILPDIKAAHGGLSIAPLVRQGLRAKDDHSIDKVISRNDRRIIDATVAQLTGAEAFDLLQECSKRMPTQLMQGRVLGHWIQRLLLRHCTFLSSQPVLMRALQPLHDIFEARCSRYRTLCLLRGRLQVAHDHGAQVVEKKRQEKEIVRAPLVEYVEGDEDAAEDSTSEGADGEGGGEDSLDEDIFDEDLEDELLDLGMD